MTFPMPMFSPNTGGTLASLVFVGAQVDSRAGTVGAGTWTVNFALTGGTHSTPQAGDLVIVGYSVPEGTDIDVSAPSTWNIVGTEAYVNAGFDTNAAVYYKFMGGSPDTSITLKTASVNYGRTVTISVWRNVDTGTTFDVATVQTNGTSTCRPNPGAITPSTAGSYIVVMGFGGSNSNGNFTNSDLTDFRTTSAAGSSASSECGTGYLAWTSGPFDGAQWGAGGSTLNATWAAWAMALRPATI